MYFLCMEIRRVENVSDFRGIHVFFQLVCRDWKYYNIFKMFQIISVVVC